MKDESLLFLSFGPVAALLLGTALVPLRGLTPASNLSFAFMALTIVVAELGGRWAATATALTSALSLDFFLTQPYLRLAIEDKHDVIAFIGLAVCGLIAASLGARRGERIAALQGVQRHHDLLGSVLRDWDAAAPAGPQLARILAQMRQAFPLAALVLRDARGQALAGGEAAEALGPPAAGRLHADTLLPEEREPSGGRWDLALPEAGGRLALAAGARPVGWLDLWGNGEPAGAESRRALSDLARLLALLLAGAR